MIPHEVLKPAPRWARWLWALLRGVNRAEDWRAKCSRCGLTCQMHLYEETLLICWRFHRHATDKRV